MTMRTRGGTRRAFTLVELAALTAAGVVGAAAVTVTLQPPAGGGDKGPVGARDLARQRKDATQVRTIVQGMITFAQNNRDQFPLPSALDTGNATAAAAGAAKDTTANIFSIMVYNGMISPEMCVSPAESNANIVVDTDYKFTDPPAAAKPATALWDPAFAADFTGDKKGNVSYAHLIPTGKRLERWSDTFSVRDAVVGNRGPEIESATAAADGSVAVKTKLEKSNTFLIHGPKESWEGNIGYADGHVGFETAFTPKPTPGKPLDWATYTNKEGKKVADVHFFDEPDDAEGMNLYLGIFTTAGEKRENFTAIWD